MSAAPHVIAPGPPGLLSKLDLIERWRIQGPTKEATNMTYYRRLLNWKLRPMRGTRGDTATFRINDVLAAEARAAGERRPS